MWMNPFKDNFIFYSCNFLFFKKAFSLQSIKIIALFLRLCYMRTISFIFSFFIPCTFIMRKADDSQLS